MLAATPCPPMTRPAARLRLIRSDDAPKGLGPEEQVVKGTLDEAFRAYAPYVAAIAFRLLGRDHEVDDVVQDVFLAAHRGLATLRDPEAVKGWLATVTVRVARRRLWLRKFRSFLRLDDAPAYADVASSGASPEQKALLARVYVLLDALPVEQRVAWVLRHVEGEELSGVASACACSLATAKRRIAAASDAIERAMSDG